MILVAILVVTILASMVAAGLLYRMRAETSAAAAAADGEQAYRAAMSGVELVTALFAPPQQTDDGADLAAVDPSLAAVPGASAAAAQAKTFANPAVITNIAFWYDNPDLFRNHLVADDGANKWYFSIYSHNALEPTKVRFGLTDESAKININLADAATLLRLPGMTPALVDALLDYRDKDSETRGEGGEQDYYDQLPQPYTIKNGPLATIEELLLVKGFNASIVYGEDANLNFLLEPNEDDADESFPSDNNDGLLNRGLFGAATTVGYGPDLRPDGKLKTDLNGSATKVRQAMTDAGLSSQTSQFVQAYVADGNKFKHPSQLLNMTYQTKASQGGPGGGKGFFAPPGGRGGPGAPGGPGGGRSQTLQSGVGPNEMAILLESFTTAPGGGKLPIPGLVNVNTAPVEVLAALPGLDAGVAQQIIDARANLDPQTLSTPAWLLTQGVVDSETFKTLAPKLTAQGYQFRLRVIGFGVPCGRYRIMEIVLDLAGPQPKVLYQRDLTRLGLPFPLDVESLQK